MNHKNSLKIIFGHKSYKSNEVIHVREEDFEIPHGEDYKLAIKELDKIHHKILQDKQFLEHFLYEDVSIWWMIYQSLIGNYKKIINFVHTFSEFLDENNPNVVEILNMEKLEIIKKICKQKNIKYTYSKNSQLQFLLKQKSKNIIKKTRFEKITNKKIENRKNIFLKHTTNKINIKNKTIFAIPGIYRRQIFDTSLGTTHEGEYIQQSIINLLNAKDIVGMDLDYTFKGNPKILSNRLNDLFPWMPIEILIKTKQFSNKTKFLATYKKLILSKNFQQFFNYNGIKLWDEIEPVFNEMMLSPHLPFYLDLIDSLSELFIKNPPKAFFLPYETGPIALCIIAACKKYNISTIGVQHGHIYEFNPMYCYANSLENRLKHGFFLPDHILLFGNSTKKLLLKNYYPSEKLVIFGNPAFFGLENFLKTFDKKKNLDKFGINNNKKIILFTSGKLQRKYYAHGKYDYDEQIWNDLIEKFGNDENFFLILKPHPQEQDVTIYENTIKKYNCNNAIITHDSIYDLISLSDIVLSVFSTTMIDALCFQKPVIRVKFGVEKSPLFDSTNVIINSDLKSLSTNINSILLNSNQKIKNDIVEFIKNQYGIPENNPSKILDSILSKNISKNY